jgi:ATP/ADP translocase
MFRIHFCQKLEKNIEVGLKQLLNLILLSKNLRYLLFYFQVFVHVNTLFRFRWRNSITSWFTPNETQNYSIKEQIWLRVTENNEMQQYLQIYFKGM